MAYGVNSPINLTLQYFDLMQDLDICSKISDDGFIYCIYSKICISDAKFIYLILFSVVNGIVIPWE